MIKFKDSKQPGTALERRCLMKFFLKDQKLFQKFFPDCIKVLGIEGAFEIMLHLLDGDKPSMKVLAKDEANFVVLFDEAGKQVYSPMFIMKDGIEEVICKNEEDDI